eukprot:470292-Prorocentrum_minimum.AAC.1
MHLTDQQGNIRTVCRANPLVRTKLEANLLGKGVLHETYREGANLADNPAYCKANTKFMADPNRHQNTARTYLYRNQRRKTKHQEQNPRIPSFLIGILRMEDQNANLLIIAKAFRWQPIFFVEPVPRITTRFFRPSGRAFLDAGSPSTLES